MLLNSRLAMKLILDSIFELGDYGLSSDELRKQSEHLASYLESFKRRGQGFPHLPKLKAQVLAVKQLVQSLQPRFERGELQDIVVIGMGGPGLGAHCVRDVLKGPYWNHHGKPRLFVLDNLDLAPELEKTVDLDRALFVVATKSSTTPETLAHYFYFRDKVKSDQFVFIVDPNVGYLRELGERESIPMLDFPENVGGRFSILSPAGLFPAALLGIDIEELLSGAEEMSRSFFQMEFDLNLPFQFAAVQYLLEWKHGIHMTVMMPYSSALWTLADWYRQLLAESIGKEGKGLTPIKALGPRDQHSQLQLYNEGPSDKLIVFIEVGQQAAVSVPKVDVPGFEYLSELSLHKLMNVQKKGTEKALTEYKKANLTLQIPEISPYHLGELLMFFEGSVAFLGEFYGINAFDQPGVELSKRLTKALLDQNL